MIYCVDISSDDITIANFVSDLYFRNKTLKIIRNLSIPIIDVHEEVFKKHTDPLSLFPFRLYGHYTTEGYDLIANTIVKKIYEFENK